MFGRPPRKLTDVPQFPNEAFCKNLTKAALKDLNVVRIEIFNNNNATILNFQMTLSSGMKSETVDELYPPNAGHLISVTPTLKRIRVCTFSCAKGDHFYILAIMFEDRMGEEICTFEGAKKLQGEY